MSSQDSQNRHFSRRLKAAVEGLHLPSEEELLRGMALWTGWTLPASRIHKR